MKKSERMTKRLNRAKRICERLVNKHKSIYVIVKDNENYFIMTEKRYIEVWKTSCIDKKLKYLNHYKTQKYFDFTITDEEVKNARERRKEFTELKKVKVA